MQGRKILAIGCVVIGAAMLLFSNYIADQVASGQAEIRSAQTSVNAINSAFDSSSYTKGVGKIITNPAQKEINQGREEVAFYGSLASKIQIGGIVLIAVGVVLFFTGKKRS